MIKVELAIIGNGQLKSQEITKLLNILETTASKILHDHCGLAMDVGTRMNPPLHLNKAI